MVSDFSKIANVPMSAAALRTAYNTPSVTDPGATALNRLRVVERKGQHWLQQTFSHDHGNRSFDQGRTGTQFRMDIPGRNHEEIYLSFNMELKSDIVLSREGKFGPGLLGVFGDLTTGGNIPDGYNGFSVRNAFTSNGALESMSLYVYHAGLRPTRPAGEGINPLSNGRQPVPWPKGVPMGVQIRIKMNTPETSQGAGNGRRDGILQKWLNGTLIIDRRDMLWRHDDAIHINQYIYSAFYGGGSPPHATVKEETVWTANHAVSNKPLLYNPPR